MIRTFVALALVVSASGPWSARADGPLLDQPRDAVRAELRGDDDIGDLKVAWPLCAKPSSGFGYRVDAFTGRVAFHSGLDIGHTFGLKVRAAHGGQVVAAERRGPYGLMVELENPNGYRTRYGHLRAVFVKAGDEIGAGHLLGEVGATGRAAYPHLHFEVWRHDRVWDPLKVLPPREDCVSAAPE